jgi:heme A synthase
MTVRSFAAATAAATFLLLLVGGLVNPTGSSLACPDWPLCHGSAFPEMTGGILYEHSHRLVASAVGLMTVILAVLAVRDRRRDPLMARLGILAVLMVCLQGVLGGLTVIYKLPPEISIAHLALSMFFFTFLVYMAVRARGGATVLVPAPIHRLTVAGTVVVYAQIVLGGLVRHSGSAMACANDIPFCFGDLWPAMGPGRIHMAHRLLGVAVGLYVIFVAIAAAGKLAGRLRQVAVAVPALVVAQIALGIYTVLTMKALWIVEAHLGVGVLLLASMAVLTFATRPAR